MSATSRGRCLRGLLLAAQSPPTSGPTGRRAIAAGCRLIRQHGKGTRANGARQRDAHAWAGMVSAFRHHVACVVGWSAQEQVRGVAASRNVARVADQSRIIMANRPIDNLVHGSVRMRGRSLPPEFPIAIGSHRADPQPTRIRSTNSDARKRSRSWVSPLVVIATGLRAIFPNLRDVVRHRRTAPRAGSRDFFRSYTGSTLHIAGMRAEAARFTGPTHEVKTTGHTDALDFGCVGACHV